jgi:hypothetical protein
MRGPPQSTISVGARGHGEVQKRPSFMDSMMSFEADSIGFVLQTRKPRLSMPITTLQRFAVAVDHRVNELEADKGVAILGSQSDCGLSTVRNTRQEYSGSQIS